MISSQPSIQGHRREPYCREILLGAAGTADSMCSKILKAWIYGASFQYWESLTLIVARAGQIVWYALLSTGLGARPAVIPMVWFLT